LNKAFEDNRLRPSGLGRQQALEIGNVVVATDFPVYSRLPDTLDDRIVVERVRQGTGLAMIEISDWFET
jgi:hypothetical protein